MCYKTIKYTVCEHANVHFSAWTFFSEGVKSCPELKCTAWGAASSPPDPGKGKGLRGGIEMTQSRIEVTQSRIEMTQLRI